MNWVHPLTIANMYAKFDEEAHKGLVSTLFTSFFSYVDFDLWSVTYKINRVHPLVIVNMSAKFDEKAHSR